MKIYLLGVNALWLSLIVTATLEAQTGAPLFKRPGTVTVDSPEELLEPQRFIRGEIYELNIELLQKVTEPTVFSMSVFDLGTKSVTVSPLEAPSDQSKAWRGSFPGGELILVLRESAELKANTIQRSTDVAGTLRTDDGRVFQIRSITGSQVLLREFDLERLPNELESIVPEEDMPPVAEDKAATASNPYVFSVAVFYTEKAKEGAGGTSKMNTLIDLAVTETNVAYQNSQINAKVSLVYRAQTSDDESGGFNPMLTRLQNKTDGHMDEVHTKRDQYQADLVVLICDSGSSCGLGYRMTTESASFERWAFSVVSRGCATGYYSFAHEMGHNMGCCHDAAHPESNPIYPYAYGWHFKVKKHEYRTIMAYSPGTRIQHFSNPNVKYLGVATGKAGAAENYKTINNTADTISAFR